MFQTETDNVYPPLLNQSSDCLITKVSNFISGIHSFKSDWIRFSASKRISTEVLAFP